jgi:hypothetical protein
MGTLALCFRNSNCQTWPIFVYNNFVIVFLNYDSKFRVVQREARDFDHSEPRGKKEDVLTHFKLRCVFISRLSPKSRKLESTTTSPAQP